MEVDHIGIGTGIWHRHMVQAYGTGKGKDEDKDKDKDKDKGKGKGKEAKPDKQDKECHVCEKRGHFARDCWSRIHRDKTVNEVEGAKVDADAAKTFVFTIESMVKYVRSSQSGCESHDGVVMMGSGDLPSVIVCSKWFGESALEKPDDVRLRGADGRTLQDYGRRQTWLRIGNHLKRYDFHVVDVTKPILSVSYLCENRIETRFVRQPFLKLGERHEPFIKKSSRGCDARRGITKVMRSS